MRNAGAAAVGRRATRLFVALSRQIFDSVSQNPAREPPQCKNPADFPAGSVSVFEQHLGCAALARPYYRPCANVTRGQTSKIIANTFFPVNCAPGPALRPDGTTP